MNDVPRDGAGEWPQGRNPERRRIGCLGRALVVLFFVTAVTLVPR
ncbi:hypothetical protein ACFYT4_22125 [Streptomyces sp. NPDC004609]